MKPDVVRHRAPADGGRTRTAALHNLTAADLIERRANDRTRTATVPARLASGVPFRTRPAAKS